MKIYISQKYFHKCNGQKLIPEKSDPIGTDWVMLVLVEQKNAPAVGTEAVARTDREEPELCDGNERAGGLQADGPAAKPNRPNVNEERRMENE